MRFAARAQVRQVDFVTAASGASTEYRFVQTDGLDFDWPEADPAPTASILRQPTAGRVDRFVFELGDGPGSAFTPSGADCMRVS